ncbi:MAG: hypothetical protein U5K33_10500 [Halofilum sp. (in: g-proteobacteria)]|nr:hypothetical protein [Halofilum sp. (in: g-proteobacteria)]
MSDAAANDAPRPRLVTALVYLLHALTLLLGFPILLALALNLMERDNVRGTIYESHFAWQMRTNEWALLLGAPGFVLFLLGTSLHEALAGLGALLLLLAFAWICWRALRGFAFWTQRQPVPTRARAS